jgi:hypothetical protein
VRSCLDAQLFHWPFVTLMVIMNLPGIPGITTGSLVSPPAASLPV